MAKDKVQEREGGRRSRKEILLQRKRERQLRRIRIAVGIVVGLLLLVAIVGVVNELILIPNRTIATVNGEEINLEEWQERVRFERAQRIIFLENQYEAFEGNVGIIQQFAGQTIIELQDAELFGQNVLDTMVEETIIRQAAQSRGISVSDAAVTARIEENFGYYGGESPTPAPTATGTPVPTPSLTPIPTAVITEVIPTAVPSPTSPPPPTQPPPPTPTPMTQEGFEEEFGGFTGQLQDYGVDEAVYRRTVRAQIYRERLQEALAEEANIATEAEQASLYLISFPEERQAVEALEAINTSDFLTFWNTIRSTTPDTRTDFAGSNATELLWRTQEALAETRGEAIADAAFTLPPGVPSGVLEVTGPAETSVEGEEEAAPESTYYIIQVSGREVRPLSQSAIDNQKAQLVSDLVAEQQRNVDISEFWRTRVPTQPILDPKFLAQPTAQPQPAVPSPQAQPQVVPTVEEGAE